MTVRNYCLIFEKNCEGFGEFVFIVGDERVAEQFCLDNPNFYYLTRQQWVEAKENESN